MPLAIRCPNGHKLKVPSKFAGQSVRCPACQCKFEVPAKRSANTSTQQVTIQQAADEDPAQSEKKAANSGKPAITKSRQNAKVKPTVDSSARQIKEQRLPETHAAEPEPSPATAASTMQSDELTLENRSPAKKHPDEYSATANVPEAQIAPRAPERNPLETFLLDRKLMGTSPGYRPDQRHKSSVYWLGGGQILLACFTTIPAFWQMGAEQVAPWIYLVLMLAFLQGAYAVWLCLSPDFSSAQVAMFATGLIAAIYAAATAVCWLTEARTGGWFHIGSLKMVHGNKPALWCAAVMLLASLVAYFCGHVSYRWQKTYQRTWPVKASWMK